MTGTVRWPVFEVIRFALSRDLRRIVSVLMKKWFVVMVCLWAFQASAQTTYTAKTCNLSDVSAAIASEQATHVDGDIISIPAGTCTWTGTQAINKTFNNSVIIQGAGAVSATTGGASTTGSDQTSILDHTTGSGTPIIFTTVSGKSLRVTGIYFKTDSGTIAHNDGFVKFLGSSTAVRFDHCHVTTQSGGVGVFFGDTVNGVADHNLMDSPSGSLTNDYVFHGLGYGDSQWAETDHWGTSQFMFVEDNRFHNGSLGDGAWGGRYVIRHSACVVDSAATTGECQMYNHGLTPGRQRSMRAAEMYKNTFTQPGTTGVGQPPQSINGGTMLFWGNTITQYRTGVGLDYTRKADNPPNYVYAAPPIGWGHCDGAGTFASWDTPPTGYPCLDGIARGAGDLLTGDGILNVVNSRTRTIASPNQALSPVYIWNNTLTPAGGYSGPALVGVGTSMIMDNRDYYQQFGAYAEPGSFDGTKGVGQGLLSARPSTCTAGLGGNTPGVGYWATDTNTLYVCNPTDTWTAYYTPYNYPHPLAGGTSASVNPPTSLAATVQ
jgi:hypothetical protein